MICTVSQSCSPCLSGTRALDGVERYRSVVPGFSVSGSSGGPFLFAILYQELQDYFAQGAVKFLPKPRATETTGIHFYLSNAHRPVSILNNKGTQASHAQPPCDTRYKEPGPVLFRHPNTNPACHQSNLCQRPPPPPVP